MKKLFLLISLGAFFASCSKDLDEGLAPRATEPDAEEAYQMPTTRGAVSTAVYHESAGAWMVTQPDPYALENFRAVHTKLLAGASEQTLTRAQINELAGISELQATHYALRIYPKSEEEQYKYEFMEDVDVSYTPFDYVRLSPEEIETLPAAKTRTGAAKYPESYRYTVTYTDIQATEGPMPDRTLILPILYAVWPVDKPLPTDVEYEMDYEVFLPDYAMEAAAKTRSGEAGLSFEALMAIEDEAIARAMGKPVKQRTVETESQTRGFGSFTPFFRTAYFKHWDNVVNRLVPVQNVKITYHFGSRKIIYYTDRNGGFPTYDIRFSYDFRTGVLTQRPCALPEDTAISIEFSYPKWKIYTADDNGISTPCGIGILLFDLKRLNYNLYFGSFFNQGPVLEIARAVNYYYLHQSDIPVDWNAPLIWIDSYNKRDPQHLGSFVCPSPTGWQFTPYINIYNEYSSNQSFPIGTILHELGHWSMWNFKNQSLPYKTNADKILAESWASYSGWLLTEKYYRSLGWVKPSYSSLSDLSNWIDYNFTGNSRQFWRKTTASGYYSPLYVDLVDDINQSIVNEDYLEDLISGFPNELIVKMAKESAGWPQLRARLQQSIRAHDAKIDFKTHIAPYDNWFANN